MQPTQNINIRGTVQLVSPNLLKEEIPASETTNNTVVESREAVKRILDGHDPRLIVVVGPCSIHDEKAGIEYAKRLSELASRVSDRLMLIMRVYFEKPRTTVGWKGLINDPHLNDTFDVQNGLRIARRILTAVGDLELPAATEMLEPITPQYIADLITLGSIGARTTESPTHRQMASGLSMPVGFKNGTDGSLETAINAMQAALTPHSFLGIDPEGKTCVVQTSGNPWGHVILRGGRSGPNYGPESIKQASEQLHATGLAPRLVVDCSHANSDKDYTKQPNVWNNVVEQRIDGNESIVGLMLESNLNAGKQSLGDDTSQLKYGVSITDGCIGWEETESLIVNAYERLETCIATVEV